MLASSRFDVDALPILELAAVAWSRFEAGRRFPGRIAGSEVEEDAVADRGRAAWVATTSCRIRLYRFVKSVQSRLESVSEFRLSLSHFPLQLLRTLTAET